MSERERERERVRERERERKKEGEAEGEGEGMTDRTALDDHLGAKALEREQPLLQETRQKQPSATAHIQSETRPRCTRVEPVASSVVLARVGGFRAHTWGDKP